MKRAQSEKAQAMKKLLRLACVKYPWGVMATPEEYGDAAAFFGESECLIHYWHHYADRWRSDSGDLITRPHNLFSGLRQDLRSKELRRLLAALVISVSALTSVSFLADRMHRASEFDSRQLLASDLLIVADQATPTRFN
jgi:hypothetical protein